MSSREAAQITLREMTARDLRAVRRIERRAYPDAWSRRVFEQELRNGFARYSVVVAGGVRSDPAAAPGTLFARLTRRGVPAGAIVGFFGVWFMEDQLHLVTIAVDPARQRAGIGSRMLLDCFAVAAAAELATIVLEVRVSNRAAQALYAAHGFRTVGRLTRYYKDDGEDALVMTTAPLTNPETQEAIERLRAAHRARYPGYWGVPAVPPDQG